VHSYNSYDQYIAMTRLNVSRTREEFPEVVNRAAYGKERTIVSRRGKDLVAVIPIEDLRLLERHRRHHRSHRSSQPSPPRWPFSLRRVLTSISRLAAV